VVGTKVGTAGWDVAGWRVPGWFGAAEFVGTAFWKGVSPGPLPGPPQATTLGAAVSAPVIRTSKVIFGAAAVVPAGGVAAAEACSVDPVAAR
jgi:hypothetical protein